MGGFALGRAAGLHAAFALLALLLLALPWSLGPLNALGWRITVLVGVYNLALLCLLPLTPRWRSLWWVLFPLSLLQIFPDWFLSRGLWVLKFSATGGPCIGPVPAYMAGLWIVALFLPVLLGQYLWLRVGRLLALAATTLVSTAVMLFGEWLAWWLPMWRAAGVATTLHVAHYVVLPLALIGPACLLAVQWAQGRGAAAALLAAVNVMLVYTGAASLSYLFLAGGN